MSTQPENFKQFESLVEIVKALRGPHGCPWDKEQTHQSLTRFAIEETFELAEAIDAQDTKAMVEELGDVLFQVLLHAEIGRQDQKFTLEDVIEGVTRKMVSRHPHVFSDVKVKDSNEVLKNWNELKDKEKGKKKNSSNMMEFDIPVNMPALLRSQKIGDKTKKLRFDWQNATEVMSKVEEELGELKEAMHSGTFEEREHELGDLLFSTVQLARHLQIDSEQTLRLCNTRFLTRFKKMGEIAERKGLKFDALEMSDLEKLWIAAKKEE